MKRFYWIDVYKRQKEYNGTEKCEGWWLKRLYSLRARMQKMLKVAYMYEPVSVMEFVVLQ